eukprot:TRINITY_DN959_c0_g1_i1.p1 TRINITY_DN959_c0_g1~~TRINITY_DN959_c0_g1_i1.p1  ORF type:complete len:226 (+),score=58.52 TRINITY_DN959_c0_g1_i1:22-699(+)
MKRRHDDAAAEKKVSNTTTTTTTSNHNPAMSLNVPTPNRNFECPLCLETFIAATETSCGHCFCAPCLLSLYKSNGKQKIKCPTDRREVSMMIPSWTIRSAVEEKNPAGELKGYKTTREYDEEIEEYNTTFLDAKRAVVTHIQEDFVLLGRIFRGRVLIYKIIVIALFILSVGYLVWPADIIPDAENGIIGYSDDFFVVLATLWILALFIEWYRRRLAASVHERTN